MSGDSHDLESPGRSIRTSATEITQLCYDVWSVLEESLSLHGLPEKAYLHKFSRLMNL